MPKLNEAVKGWQAETRKEASTKAAKTTKQQAESERRRGLRHGLTVGRIPIDSRFIKGLIHQFRRHIEDAVLDVKGEIGVADAASINTATRWETHAQLCRAWLNRSVDELSPMDRLSYSREIARASSERDKAIKSLGLDRDVVQDAWSMLDLPENDHG